MVAAPSGPVDKDLGVRYVLARFGKGESPTVVRPVVPAPGVPSCLRRAHRDDGKDDHADRDPLVPRTRRTVKVPVRLDGDLHDRLVLTARGHGYVDLEDFFLDLLTDARNLHVDCPQCRRVARGAGRPEPSGLVNPSHGDGPTCLPRPHLEACQLGAVLGGLVSGLIAAYEVRGPSPAEQLGFMEFRERNGTLFPGEVQELAALRIRRDTGNFRLGDPSTALRWAASRCSRAEHPACWGGLVERPVHSGGRRGTVNGRRAA